MFSALAGYPKTEDDYYGRKLPNLLLSPNPPKGFTATDAAAAINVLDPYTHKLSSPSKGNLSKIIRGVEVDDALRKQAAVCAAATSPGQLAGMTDYKKKVRCGWVLKEAAQGIPQPTISQGAIGTSQGPLSFFPHEEGVWFWDLNACQKRIDSMLSRSLTTCRDVGNDPYYGKVGFCQTSGRGVPITPDGSIKYPKDPLLSCSSTALITEPGSCPPPPAPGSPAAIAAAASPCSVDANGQISKNCILNRLLAGGCSDQGSLAVALQTGSTPNNYAASLESVPAYTRYQAHATTPLNTDILTQGAGSASVALASFQGLANTARAANSNTSIGAAARDLCLQQGIYAQYDFCTELSDSTRSPFALECLQREFRRAGGQPAGTLYPSQAPNPLQSQLDAVNKQLNYLYGLGLGPGSDNDTFNRLYAQQQTLSAQVAADNTFAYWNTQYSTWGAVKTAMAALAAATKSTNKDEQTSALNQFLGIALQQSALTQIKARAGCELMFFPGTTASPVFLGRRVLTGDDFPQIPTATTGSKFFTGFSTMQFAILTNLRPDTDTTNVAFMVTTQDGTALSVNTDIDPIRTTASTTNYFSQFLAQAGATQYQSECMSLVAGGPNYMTVRYFNTSATATFQLQLKNCTTGAITTIPPGVFTLTQEPAAPFAAFEAFTMNDTLTFGELRLGRGLFAAVTGGNGTAALTTGTLPGGLAPFQISAGASWTVKTPIAFQSLRSITFVWSLIGGAVAGQIFSWIDPVSGNGLTLSLAAGQQLVASWSATSVNTSVQGMIPIPLSGSAFYTRITFEAVGGASLPNQIRIATVAMNLNDISNLETPANQILLVAANGVLFKRLIQDATMSGLMGFGVATGGGAGGGSGVGIQVGFLHLFDYIVDPTKTQLDVSGNWKRAFIYS